ncbi:MAG: nucleotide exchange factor GrpE [Anaerolineales bacterium]|nr:nucleotide exchange factor GrpE [Anaerolineales bacterium]
MADENATFENVDSPPAEEDARALEHELETVKTQAAEYLEGWQRARAEFANYKRRVEKEQADMQQNATARVVGRFLDVIDDFDRAMQDQPAPEADADTRTKWAVGIGLIQRKLQNLLDAEGVERIAADGQPFDPNLHEAVTHEDSGAHEPGRVIGVIRQGYKIGDRVIRPALVRVAR